MKKIIALDLDGTLLDSNKRLTPGNIAALEEASAAGILIVPSTGRFYKGMPESVRSLPFIEYAITINGASVINVRTLEVMYEACIPADETLEIMSFLDTLPVIYDCYYGGWGYMSASMRELAPSYISSEHLLRMVLDLRSPVDDIKAWIREGERSPQKIMAFTDNDPEYKYEVIQLLQERFPHLKITSSHPTNIEINTEGADKGLALKGLADALGIDINDTAAVGDGLNDLTMIRSAGTGVAMANSCREVLESADLITDDCDHDGAGKAVRMLMNM